MAFTMNHSQTALEERHGPQPLTGLAPDIVPSPYFRWKPLPARILAGFLLIPALPIIGLAVIIVRLSSPGPGIFHQVRVGRHGKHFTMYKLRTMRNDAEAKSGPVWTQPDDDRITRVGRLFRRLHVDELPQLFNVVRGEMALIGPRPERPEFVHRLADEIPGYLNRLAVRPGVTGLSQINLPPDTTIDSVRAKLVLDVEYIETAGPWLDLRIFFCTALRFIGIRGLLPARLLGLYIPSETDTDDEPATAAADQPQYTHEGNGNGRASSHHRVARRRPR